jgi:hypothetical protein
MRCNRGEFADILVDVLEFNALPPASSALGMLKGHMAVCVDLTPYKVEITVTVHLRLLTRSTGTKLANIVDLIAHER